MRQKTPGRMKPHLRISRFQVWLIIGRPTLPKPFVVPRLPYHTLQSHPIFLGCETNKPTSLRGNPSIDFKLYANETCSRYQYTPTHSGSHATNFFLFCTTHLRSITAPYSSHRDGLWPFSVRWKIFVSLIWCHTTDNCIVRSLQAYQILKRFRLPLQSTLLWIQHLSFSKHYNKA